MSDATDRDAAFEELVRRVPCDSEPTLSADDLEGIVDNNQRARRWAASTALTLDSKPVIPTVRMGRIFRVIVAGISGSIEPAWPTGDGDTVVDGTVMLIEAGADFSNVFDIRGAIQEALTLKALRSAEFHAGDESKIHDHFKEMAREWATPLIG